MASQAGRTQRGRRYNGGQHSWQRKMFTKLVKDENATFSPRDTQAFLQGMDSFESKPELLLMITDNRNHGERRLHDCLSMIDMQSVDDILVRLLSNILTEETSRSLHKARRSMAVNMIYNAPGFIEFLATEWLVSIDQSGAKSLEVITQLLIDASLALVEARSSESVKAIAKIMRKFDTKLSHRLCAILQLDNSQDAEKRRTKKKENKRNPDVVCWGADLDVPGERHDNDHPNFRDISLVPTKDELSFQGRSWLPLASGANSFVDDQAQCLLDRNFRLLREDAVGAMKENLVDPRGFKVWKNARIIGASCKDVHNPRGTAPLHFFVQLDLPQGRAIDWKRQRSFPYDGLVAFHNGKQDVMASIFIRKCDQPNQWLLCPGGPVIGVIFHHDNDVRTAISDISVNKDTNKLYQAKVEELKNISNPQQRQGTKEEMAELKKIFKTYNLIEVSDSFFAYRPVLEALTKMISVPLAEELVHIQKYPERPSYLPKNVRLPQAFKRLEVDLEQWSESSMLEKTTLDESQSKALHMALTSRVALIQGPPGCGKTFIGSLLAQIIRDNTDESILCVCYTNHALDQFLDHMLKQGETRLVRIGGRTKSDALKDYELKSLSKREKSLSVSDADRRMRSVVAQMHRCKEEITDLLEALEMPLEWKYATEVFDSIDGQLYLNFDAAQDDGFAVVGRNNAKINDEALFNMWKNGSDCPEWLYDILRWEDDFENLWMLQPAQRLERLNEWKGLQFEELTGMIHDARQRYEALSAEKRDIGHEIDSYVLKEARIVGATTTGAAKYCDLLANKSASVVIVEEAGEVLEPHVLTAMTEQKDNSEETKHLILIGDHLQLRPKLESYSLTKVSGLGLDFDVSLFERLILSGYESAMLQVQHRMRPCIADIIRRQTYPTLKDHPSVFNYPSTLGVPRTSNLLFLDHCHPENGGDDATTTKSNTFEASMCVEIVRFLLLQGYCHDQVTILTPYVGQIMAVVREMKRNLSDVTTYVSDLDQEELLRQEEDAELDDVTPKEKKKGTKFVRCASIDNFQGEESDVVIICLVRSNKQGNIGFLKEEQRVNVLLSRAKHGMFIIGNSTTLRSSSKGKHIWIPILDMFESQGLIAKAFPTVCQLHPSDGVTYCASPQDFRTVRPNGGCRRPCNVRLECGHACPLLCHPTDQRHLITHRQCTQPCRRIPPNCPRNHPCTKLCNENCGQCLEIVEDTILPCGHAAKSPTCDSVRNDHSLKELAQKCDQSTFHVFSPCGHECETTCGNAKSDTPLCPGLCGKMLECGHPCQHRCQSCKGDDKHSCKLTCERSLFCGHVCGRPCHGTAMCPPCNKKCPVACLHSKCAGKCKNVCSSCVEKCDWQCEHQGSCSLVCGAPCNRLPCNERCPKILPCGHQCPSLCGEDCPEKKYCVQCCSQETKTHIVDMLEFNTYEDQDLDADPVILLKCGHFYSMATLDGYGTGQSLREGPQRKLYWTERPLNLI